MSATTCTSRLARLNHAAKEFALAPASARPLAVLRIGLAWVLLVQALAIAPNVLDLFGPRGVVQYSLSETMVVPGVPRMSWVVQALAHVGVSEVFAVRASFLLYVAGLSALMFGWRTRLAAIVAWSMHLVVMMTQRTALYGVDDFANIALFYCMWMPVGHYWSMDVVCGRASSAPSWEARLSLRVLQIHLCMVYLSSGIEKALQPPYQWWDGEILWRTFLLPEYRQFDMTWLADVPWLVKMASIGALFLELGYAFLVWPLATRKVTAIATLAMHLGIAVFMGLVTFGLVMIVLSAAAWLTPAEVK